MLLIFSSLSITKRKALFLSLLELFLHYSYINRATVSRVCWPLAAGLTHPLQAVGAPVYCTLWPAGGAPGHPGGTPLAV